jgi:hypothetical protein
MTLPACRLHPSPATAEYGTGSNDEETNMAISVEKLGADALELTVHGTVRKDDYELFRPHVEARIDKHDKPSLLVHVADLTGFTPAALWEDLKFDAAHYNDIERIGIVGEDTSRKWMATLAKPFTQADVRYFQQTELDEARRWVRDG